MPLYPSFATAYQALDSDLTAIAALSTTSFGRSILDDADAAAGRTTLGMSANGSSLVSAADYAAMLALLIGAPTAWTPTVTSSSGTITSASGTGGYWKLGRLVIYQAQLTVTTNGTGAGQIRSTLPVTAVASAVFSGAGTKIDSGTNRSVAVKLVESISRIAVVNSADGSYPAIDGTVFDIVGFYTSAS